MEIGEKPVADSAGAYQASLIFCPTPEYVQAPFAAKVTAAGDAGQLQT